MLTGTLCSGKEKKSMNLGVKIKMIRKEMGISQRELAEKLGVCGRLVSHWEKGGNRKISSDKLLELARISGKGLDFFYSEDTPTEEETDESHVLGGGGEVVGNLALAQAGNR